MQHTQSSKKAGQRRAWEAPTITVLNIHTETKFIGASDGKRQLAEPAPSPTYTNKLGFSFEWAFPLSVRHDK